MIKLTLDEIVKSRQRRAKKIQGLVKEYNHTVVCLTLNVPGKIRVFELLQHAFNDGCKRFENAFGSNNAIIHKAYSPHATGYEAYFILDRDAKDVKIITSRLEEADELGTIFNFDVFDVEGKEILRADVGVPLRKCLLCNEAASKCIKQSTHTPEEVVIKVQQILQKYYD